MTPIPSNISNADLSALVAQEHDVAPVNLPCGAVQRDGQWFMHNGPYALPCENVFPPYAESLDAVLPLITANGGTWQRNGEGGWGIYNRTDKWTWFGELEHNEQTDARKACFCCLLAKGYTVEETTK